MNMNLNMNLTWHTSPTTSFKMPLRNTGWATQYLSHMWLSTNAIIHCESYNLQAGAKSPLTGAKRPQSGAKRPGAKRLGGETCRWRNVQWGAKHPGCETSKGWNVHKPWHYIGIVPLHNVQIQAIQEYRLLTHCLVFYDSDNVTHQVEASPEGGTGSASGDH